MGGRGLPRRHTARGFTSGRRQRARAVNGDLSPAALCGGDPRALLPPGFKPSPVTMFPKPEGCPAPGLVRAAGCAGTRLRRGSIRFTSLALQANEPPPPAKSRRFRGPRGRWRGSQAPVSGTRAQAERPAQERGWRSCWWEANVRGRREAGEGAAKASRVATPHLPGTAVVATAEQSRPPPPSPLILPFIVLLV